MDLPIGSRKVAPFSLIQLAKLYNSGHFTDFTISVAPDTETRPVEFKVHRIILAAASEYFAALFQVGTKESREGRLTLTKTNPKIFQKLIESVYGQTQTPLQFKEQIELLKMIKYYRFFVPMDRLHRFIASMEVPNDGITDYVSMVEYVYDELNSDTIDLIAKKITPDSQLVKLSDELLHLVLSSKQFPRNNFENELQVFHFIHRLVLLDHTTDLYRYVKLTNLSSEERANLIASDQLSLEILDRYLETSHRYPLTFNLKDHLIKQFELDQEPAFDPIVVIVSKEHHLLSKRSIGVFVRGDGDQTPIQVLLNRTSQISEGDIIEILEYGFVSDRRADPPFYLYTNKWRTV